MAAMPSGPSSKALRKRSLAFTQDAFRALFSEVMSSIMDK